MTFNKSVKQYLKSVRKSLPCSLAEKSAIIYDLKQNILATDTNDEWTTASLEERFGTSDEIANGFCGGDLPKELHKKIIKSKLFYWITLGACALVLCILLCVFVSIYSSNSASTMISNY